MHDGTYLSYLGLTELETKVLKSIFTLAPQLKENFTLIPRGSDPRERRRSHRDPPLD
jgi:hypothetical protein